MSLDIKFENAILTLTLNRPNVRNALDIALIQALL